MEEWFKNKKGLFWLLIWEMFCTLSNKPSFFASKRIERFIMFVVGIWLTVGYSIRHWYDMDVYEVLEITGMLLLGSAWNSTQIRKDQKELPNGNAPVSETTPAV